MRFLTLKDLEKLLRKIYHGEVNIKRLPVEVYEKTANKLIEGMETGFGFSDYVTAELRRELTESIYIFSGAKTYTQVKDISSLILDGRQLRPYSEFKKMATEKFNLYNTDYLETEYETAIGQAQTAVKWNEIQQDKELFPYVQRKAIMDANTSDECKVLNEIIAPVDDPFWKTRAPLTHFRCRCILEKIDKYEDVKLSSKSQIEKAMNETEHINPLFKSNPGVDKVIFNDSHPYFDIAPKDKELAKKNFNLPIPK
jgi:SPP1 gp7 family putative phage head morphogenesis protein